MFTNDLGLLYYSILHDKDVQGILRPFLEVADAMIFTSPHNTNRAEIATVTAQVAEDIVNSARRALAEHESPLARYDHWMVCESVEVAVHTGRMIAGKRDLICVTGSNYTVSEAEGICKKQFLDDVPG